MMKFLYYSGVKIYAAAVKIAGIFNSKARLRTKGIKNTFNELENFNKENVIWFHCASLGEFEQGRPLIEKIKKFFPQYHIALSFFSPSGYEIRKKFESADIIFYLPDDSPKNASRLISLLNPGQAFFVKYEFWYYYLKELSHNHIPTYLISGIFREKQIFFRFYGNFFLNILTFYKHLFLQNEKSQKLLKKNGINHVSVTGDTRFDRVYENALHRKKIDLIDAFKGNKLLFIAGSTWKPDEEIIFNFINENEDVGIKYILAPHEIHESNLKRILKLTKRNIIQYSEANKENVVSADILIIDNIGMLSSLYAYAEIAYVGGGFGSGIHNTLEAAVYKIPVIFGPNYKKFEEAKELIHRNAGFSISGTEDFENLLKKLIDDKDYRNICGKNADIYVKENIGASDKILQFINL